MFHALITKTYLSVGFRRNYRTACHDLNLWKTLIPAAKQTAVKIDSQIAEVRLNHLSSIFFSSYPFSAFPRYYSSSICSRPPCLNQDKTKLVSAVTWSPGETEYRMSYIHCPLCDYKMLYPKNEKRSPAIIFLDIDGVLIELFRPRDVLEKIKATLKELFPHQNRHYSRSQQNIATARYFNREAIAGLDQIIEKIKDSGQRPLVVLSSSWRHASWLDELRNDAYGQYNFSRYLCGKTSLDFQAEENLSIESKCGFEFYKTAQKVYGIQLKNRANAIEFWLKDHGFDPEKTNFVVLDDEYVDCCSKFGPRFIETKWLLNQTNVQAAIDALCS